MKKILLTCISVLLGIAVVAQSTANLKMNLEKNKVYRIKSTSESTLSQTVNGMQQTTNIKTNFTIAIKMVDASADFLVAEVRFDTLVTNTNAMGKKVNINSASEGNIKSTEMADVMSCIMNRLSKSALFVKMNYSGKVIEIVNSKMLSEVILKDTAGITGETASITKMQIKNTVSDKALRSMVEIFTNNLPGKQVASGDKWDVTATMNSGGMSLDIITSYNLDGIKDNTAKMTAESAIKASENAEPLVYGPAIITYGDLKGSGKSNILMDTHTGLLTENTSKTHITGNLSVSVQGMNLTIPMEMDGETKFVALP